MSAPGESVNAAIRDNRVMIFSKSYCPYCARAKFLLRDELQANPVIWELDEREDGEVLQNELLKLTGQRTVPNIFINQNHVGGVCSSTNFWSRLSYLVTVVRLFFSSQC